MDITRRQFGTALATLLLTASSGLSSDKGNASNLSQKNTPKICPIYTKEEKAPYRGFNVRTELSFESQPPFGAMWVDFNGNQQYEMVGLLNLEKVEGINPRERPLTPGLLEYMAMTGSAPITVLTYPIAAEQITKNRFLRDLLANRIFSPNLKRQVVEANSNKQRAIIAKKPKGLVPPAGDISYVFHIPSILPSGTKEPQIAQRPPLEVEPDRNMRTYFSIIRTEDSLEYAQLDLSFDGAYHRGEVVGMLDLRNITRPDPEKHPINGDLVKGMAAMGSAPIEVYVMPKAQGPVEKNPAIREGVNHAFHPSLRRHYVKKDSREYGILTTGNPSELLPKEPPKKPYIFSPPRISPTE